MLLLYSNACTLNGSFDLKVNTIVTHLVNSTLANHMMWMFYILQQCDTLTFLFRFACPHRRLKLLVGHPLS